MSPTPSTAAPFAAAVLVGPGDLEVRRLADLADSLGAFETGPAWFVIVDDNATPRDLDRAVALPPNIQPVALHHHRPAPRPTFHHGGGLCSCVLLALQWVQANTDASFLLKLDTDSLIIAPFADRLRRLFSTHPLLGMAGAHTMSPNGEKRAYDLHGVTVRRLLKPPFDWRRPLHLARKHPADSHDAHIAHVIRAALANGYDPGEHCLGGGYALSRTALDRMGAAGYLNAPMNWIDTDLAEDVMVAAHVRAAGLQLGNNVDAGDVFGVRYIGLPARPAALLERGYGVIHSVKNDPHLDETTIRDFFKKDRSGMIRNGSSAAQTCSIESVTTPRDGHPEAFSQRH